MSYLKMLSQHGIRASIRSEGILWLEPRSAITDDIRRMVRENKSAIIAELEEKCEPADHIFPPDGAWHFTEPVAYEAVAKVDAIRDLAIGLGWSEAGLYQNRGCYPFPYGQEYGLVCLLSGSRYVGEVTNRYIEIISPAQPSGPNRIYNPDVDHPWATKCITQDSVIHFSENAGK